MTAPRLSIASFYQKPEPAYKYSFSTPGSTFGIALLGIVMLYLSWRYQHVTYKKAYNIDDNTSTWDARNKLLDLQRQQESNLRDMQNYYYYNNLHPQQKINHILKQNDPSDLEDFVDETIAERMARAKPII